MENGPFTDGKQQFGGFFFVPWSKTRYFSPIF
jgi:hypothetical protein